MRGPAGGRKGVGGGGTHSSSEWRQDQGGGLLGFVINGNYAEAVINLGSPELAEKKQKRPLPAACP